MTGRTGEQRSHLARPRTAAFPTSAFRAAAEGRPVPGPGAPAGNPSAGGDEEGRRRGSSDRPPPEEEAPEAPLSPDDYDPYSVESCKMLHFPGAAEARARVQGKGLGPMDHSLELLRPLCAPVSPLVTANS